jgi:hypothetical protein
MQQPQKIRIQNQQNNKIMEDKELNEQESIKLISQMISNSRNRLEIGSGNTFLLWGYITVIVSFAIYALYSWIYSNSVMWLWFAIPLIGTPVMIWQGKRHIKGVVTYTDRILNLAWTTVMIAFGLLIAITFIMRASILIMPMALILCGFATTFTGIVIRDRWLTYLPVVSFAIGIIMLCQIALCLAHGLSLQIEWVLIFGACYIVMMIVPGHLLNRKASKECFKN